MALQLQRQPSIILTAIIFLLYTMRLIYNRTQVSAVIICDQTFEVNKECLYRLLKVTMHLQSLGFAERPVEYLLLYSLCTFLSLVVWELPQCPKNNSAGGFGQISSGEGGVSDKKRRETCLPVLGLRRKRRQGKKACIPCAVFAWVFSLSPRQHIILLYPP